MIHLKHGYQLVALSPIVNENVSQPLDNLSSDMEFLAMTFIIVRVMLEFLEDWPILESFCKKRGWQFNYVHYVVVNMNIHVIFLAKLVTS